MTLIKIPPAWQLSENQITPEAVFLNRRQFLRGAIATGLAASTLPLAACNNDSTSTLNSQTAYKNLIRNPSFTDVGRPITAESLTSTYNNFYEFGTGKSIWQAAQALPLENWKVEVTGLVKNPRTYDLDQLNKKFAIEERIYRFRCVEAWAMVVPWVGFPMSLLVQDVEPTSEAKFVRFTSFYDPQITKGGSLLGARPWPYTESLRLDEMMNDLAFFATGVHGKPLPKQNGAPLRMVMPWKYGFKGAKSIVKIEFLATQPATFWNTINANEYDVEANVNPSKPHPRWSQATERMVSDAPSLLWETRPTLPYNGYGEYVAKLYAS